MTPIVQKRSTVQVALTHYSALPHADAMRKLCANIYPSRLNHPIIPALILAILITPAEFG